MEDRETVWKTFSLVLIYKMDTHMTTFIKWLLNEVVHVKNLAQCLAHSKTQ